MSLQSVELAAAAGCSRWIGLGSQAEYGNQDKRLDERAATLPTTLYGKAKLATGTACLALGQTLGISAAWLRVFSTYGSGDAPNWLLQYALREFQAGRSPQLTKCTQLWDYLHVSDAARAISTTAENKAAVGTFNLGSGTARPLRYWVDLLRKSLGSKIEPEYGIIPFRPDQVMLLEADISRITAETGWKPMMSPEEGIATLFPINQI
jgi:nucleoside-diphosphate-sugar epimerase